MFFKDIFIKLKCVSCFRVSKHGICESCINQLQKIPKEHCPVCKSIDLTGGICNECIKRNPYFINLTAAGIYNGLLKNLIYDYKYQKLQNYAYPLGYILSTAIKNEIDFKYIDIITSIPLHEEKLKSRGFNQSELIARETAKILGKKYQEIFGRIKNTKPQFSLSAEERENNLKDAFEVINLQIKNKTILIVDDIFTTGSTIQEVSKLIKPYSEKIYIAVLARSIA